MCMFLVYYKLMPESFWNQMREEYNSLSHLTRTLDSCISKIVFLSFASNLYFICLQLLNSLRYLMYSTHLTCIIELKIQLL